MNITPTRVWSKETAADGDFFKEEFENIYENILTVNNKVEEVTTSGKIFSTGDIVETISFVKSGWLPCDGLTIGQPGSNATSRQNLDVLDLYIMIWNNIVASYIPIYEANGNLASRGVSALADWGALKAISLPNLTGRASIGTGIYGLGQIMGSETELLTMNHIPNHNHGGGNHTHIFEGIFQNPGPLLTQYYLPLANLQAAPGVAPTFNNYLSGLIINAEGGNLPHNNMQPSIAINKFIKI